MLPRYWTVFLFIYFYTECFGTVLKQLTNDLTGPENAVCNEPSLLRPLCRGSDQSLLGPTAHQLDQHYIEEQVSFLILTSCIHPDMLVFWNLACMSKELKKMFIYSYMKAPPEGRH